MTTAEAPAEIPVHIQLRGGNWTAYNATEPEILVEGGAGTGKTFAILLRLNQHAQEIPGYRGLIVRKTAKTIAGTAGTTLQENVFHEWDNTLRASAQDGVHFFGGSQSEPESYQYSNGSRIVVGGMDQPSKVLGSTYDEIFCNEATELSAEDWETLTGRVRHSNPDGTPFMQPQAMIADCNPSYDKHWLLARANAGKMRRLKTTLQDNPAFWRDGDWTPAGRGYLERLQSMTGTRYQRFFLGEWVGMENAIYADAMDASEHLIQLPDRPAWTGKAYGGMDFGRVHLSAVVAITVASDDRVWVREVWTGHNDKESIKSAVHEQRARYKVIRGVTDPIQDWAAQDLGWTIAKSGAGSRKGRIQRVLSLLENDLLRFDRYGEGVQDLWDEMQMYRYEVRETDTTIEDIVVRKDDDRVAALEYAVEAMETRAEYSLGGDQQGARPYVSRVRVGA